MSLPWHSHLTIPVLQALLLSKTTSHTTYTHVKPQIMKPCTPTDCAQPPLSLKRHCVSLLFFFSPFSHTEKQSSTLWEPDDERDEGWGRVCVWETERNAAGCLCQVPTVPLNAPHPSYTQTHFVGVLFLFFLSHEPVYIHTKNKCGVNGGLKFFLLLLFNLYVCCNGKSTRGSLNWWNSD